MTTSASLSASLDAARAVLVRLRGRLRHAVRGREDVIELVLVALLADGHVLLEDYPGSGKTTLAKALGDAIIDDLPEDEIAAFRRIQFTPDLLPSDITGVTVFDADTSLFQFRRGPVFAYVVLADEINRTSPKVQSAMLEAMAEKQVTVDNTSYRLDPLFFVIATQNPRDTVGTYPLPVAQLDRFLFKIRMDYIDRDAEVAVLTSLAERKIPPDAACPRVARREIIDARLALASGIAVSPVVYECLVDLARELRADPRVALGVSTRSLVLLVPALQASALMHGRDFVSSADLEWLAPFVFRHRMELAPGCDDPEAVIAECLRRPIEELSRRTIRGA